MKNLIDECIYFLNTLDKKTIESVDALEIVVDSFIFQLVDLSYYEALLRHLSNSVEWQDAYAAVKREIGDSNE